MATETFTTWDVFNDGSIGVTAWNINNALDGTGTPCNVTLGFFGTSQYLCGTTTLLSSPIPSGATINGIEVKFTKRCDSGNISDNQVAIIKTRNLITGTGAGSWPTSFTTVTYGGPSDLWGQTWVDTEFIGPDFGAAIACLSGSSDTAYVSTLEIVVYYTAAGSGGASGKAVFVASSFRPTAIQQPTAVRKTAAAVAPPVKPATMAKASPAVRQPLPPVVERSTSPPQPSQGLREPIVAVQPPTHRPVRQPTATRTRFPGNPGNRGTRVYSVRPPLRPWLQPSPYHFASAPPSAEVRIRPTIAKQSPAIARVPGWFSRSVDESARQGRPSVTVASMRLIRTPSQPFAAFTRLEPFRPPIRPVTVMTVMRPVMTAIRPVMTRSLPFANAAGSLRPRLLIVGPCSRLPLGSALIVHPTRPPLFPLCPTFATDGKIAYATLGKDSFVTDGKSVFRDAGRCER